MKQRFTFLFLIVVAVATGQSRPADSNYIFWSKDRKLQLSDFEIKTGPVGNTYSFAQFGLDYILESNFLFGLPKDYKKKIRNYMIKGASWMDTAYDVHSSIRYQQTLFDLAEIYVRKFRESVYDNRKTLARRKLRIEDINAQIMTEFSKRRVVYDRETGFATIPLKQMEWETTIANELEELKDFSAETSGD
jgi:hypothetical protein